jgi:two-component system chemotaxis response regulator CheY
MKILLVDDSRTIRNIQKKMLAEIGHTDVTEAGDGVEALEMVATERPDLMLVDWSMPNMDGITLVRKIREKDRRLPIMMVMTETEKSRVLEAVKAGVNSYMVKPFTAETLAEKVKQTMDRVAAAAGA